LAEEEQTRLQSQMAEKDNRNRELEALAEEEQTRLQSQMAEKDDRNKNLEDDIKLLSKIVANVSFAEINLCSKVTRIIKRYAKASESPTMRISAKYSEEIDIKKLLSEAFPDSNMHNLARSNGVETISAMQSIELLPDTKTLKKILLKISAADFIKRKQLLLTDNTNMARRDDIERQISKASDSCDTRHYSQFVENFKEINEIRVLKRKHVSECIWICLRYYLLKLAGQNTNNIYLSKTNTTTSAVDELEKLHINFVLSQYLTSDKIRY